MALSYLQLLQRLYALPANARSVESFLRLFFQENSIGSDQWDAVFKDLTIDTLSSGDVAGGSYSEFETDGTYKATGGATVYDDLRVPLTQTKQGSNLKPDFDQTNIGYLFPQNDASEIAYFVAQMPHPWEEGTAVFPHVHWQQGAATAVTWGLDYKVFDPNTAVPAAFTSLTGSTGEFTYTSGNLHQISRLGSVDGIDMTDKTLSALILGRLYRNDNVTTGDVLAWEIDFHYKKDTLGSRQEFNK
jgi:hypothetical protein